jgi:CRP/FNR family transcriptional regulator, cyclic AMP receptor protein
MNGLLLGLSPAERRFVRRTFDRCPSVELPASTTLTALEPTDSKLLVVDEGVVLLVAEGGPPRPTVLALACPGDVLAPPAREEHVRALTAARLVAVPQREYELLLGLPGIARALLESLLDAVDKRQQSLASLRGTHAERLQETLHRLALDHGKVCSEGVEIDLPLTHELLAQMVGSARETVTSTLGRFQREGRLVRTGRTYRLTVSPDLLEGRAERAVV